MKKHGMYLEPWFNSYRSMVDRCYRAKSHNYYLYGGRGITVCDEWKDIKNFKSWAESNGFIKGLTLDRIDVNGNYEPSNCRWVTMKTQDNNRRNTVYIKFNGEIHTVSEWASITGINRSTINNRYCRGYAVEKILNKEDLRCHA
jgi:hypothetical protein